MEYLPRIADEELRTRLRAAGAVVVEGPRACGKTETARQVASSSVLLDIDAAAREAVEVDPTLVLRGATPRLIDEWQLAPALWNHVRRLVDERREPGQFILTGSAVPADDETRHTGAGRFSRLRLRTMTLAETGHTTGETSLSALLDGAFTPTADPGWTIDDVVERITIGGWPALQDRSPRDVTSLLRDYLEEIRRVDVERVDETRRDPVKVGRLLISLARNVATEVAATTLAADAGGADEALSRHTVTDYLDALERIMVLEHQPAWAPHLRSRSRLRRAPKRHLVDPSLAVAALRATPERLLRDLNLLGLLFESLVVRDLRVYAQTIGGEVFHYRDSTGLEVDAVVETHDERWAAFEVKLGPGQIDDAATTLLKFADRVDTNRSGPPAQLGVIVATGFGYRRPDGVAVIPVGTLCP